MYSLKIPESVTQIDRGAFDACSGLQKVEFASIEALCNIKFGDEKANPLYEAHNLYVNGEDVIDLIIPESVTAIGDYTFIRCSSITSLTIPNSVTSIGNESFRWCGNLSSVSLPESITSIGANAFCYTHLTEIVLPDNIRYIGKEAFITVKVYANKNSITCLALWSSGHEKVYDPQDRYLSFSIPRINFSEITQTSITYKPVQYSSNYTCACSYSANGDDMMFDSPITRTDLMPDDTYEFYLYAKTDDSEWYKINKSETKTKGLNLTINTNDVSASGFTYEASYDKGDADVKQISLTLGGNTINEFAGNLSGLKPATAYKIELTAVVGSKNYTETATVTTDPIQFENAPAKVISVGNVIISSKTNVDDEEQNIGFEWRRQDWSDINPSNTATAFQYEGQMEGYIRNLYADALWKFRPYYLADDGTYYYGDWMGFDPTNTSYFEATVHTYDKISIEGNTALVKGYALRGTDAIKVQGFRYWKSNTKAKGHAAAKSSDYMIIEAKGQIMEATIEDLDFETEYCYQAFVETDEGFVLGETRSFTTGADPSGIDDVTISDASESIPVARYDVNGRMLTAPKKGINIIRMSNGIIKKVLVK